ncbi:MAG TPA: hypothetical protein VNA29_01130 [Sphingomicrobium sp.]|nr:hypothetical protein [Sphingomicrobium sp.]
MKAALAFAALALGGCTSIQPVIPGPTAGFRQWASVDGLKVRPVKVLEDSRCPANVTCVWAGRLRLRTDVIGGNWRRTLDLELSKPAPVADGALTLTAAQPAKQAGVSIDPRAYRFNFRFEGGL